MLFKCFILYKIRIITFFPSISQYSTCSSACNFPFNIVFVEKGNGMFEPRHVVLGPQTDEFYVIKEGLTEGERVVTNGNFMIDSESRLKSALGGMSGGHKHGN